MTTNSDKEKYIYFVSYGHERGIGNIEITSDEIISSIKSVRAIEKVIMSTPERNSFVVITNWILLSSPKDTP